jgi:archaellum component FlaC
MPELTIQDHEGLEEAPTSEESQDVLVEQDTNTNTSIATDCSFVVDNKAFAYLNGNRRPYMQLFSRYNSLLRHFDERRDNYRYYYNTHESLRNEIDGIAASFDDESNQFLPEVLKFLSKNSCGPIYYSGPLTNFTYAHHGSLQSTYSSHLMEISSSRNLDHSVYSSPDYSFTEDERFVLIDLNTKINEKKTYYVSEYNTYTIDGEKVYSKIPLEIINHMGKIFDFTSLTSAPNCSEFTRTFARKQSASSRSDKFPQWRGRSYSVGEMSDVVFAGPETIIPGTSITYESVLSSNTSMMNIKNFSSVYRGSGEVRTDTRSRKTSALFSSPCFFLFKINYNILNQKTGEIEKATFINSIVTLPTEKILKYKRAINFIPSFLNKVFAEKGIGIIDPEAHRKMIAEKFANNLVYWDKLSEIFRDRLENPDFAMSNEDFKSNKQTINDNDIDHLSKYAIALKDPNIAEYDRAKEAYKNVKESVRKAKNDISSSTSTLDHTKTRIEKYKELIEELAKDQIHLEGKITQASTTVEGYMPAIEELSSKIKTLESAKEASFKRVMESDNSETGSFIKNMAESGIIITKIDYCIPAIHEISTRWGLETQLSAAFANVNKSNPENPWIFSIKEYPEIALYAKMKKEFLVAKEIILALRDEDTEGSEIIQDISSELWEKLLLGFVPKIESITFHTKKPVIIKVDYALKGEDCTKRVAGPYEVKVHYAPDRIDRYENCWRNSSQTVNIRLCSTDAVFGHDPNNRQIWTHPHTSSRSYSDVSWNNFKSTLSLWTSGCLGDISPTINSAYQDGDVKVAIFAAMTWVTSANSVDTWGRNHTKFPLLSEVTLEKVTEISEEEKINEHLLSTEEGMEDSILDLMDTLDLQLSTVNVEIPEQPITEELTQATPTAVISEPQILPNIRRIERQRLSRNPGYVSYAQLTTRTIEENNEA